VRDTTGQHAEGLKLLGFEQLFFHPPLLTDIP